MSKPLPLTLLALTGAIALSSCKTTENGFGDGRTLFLGDFRSTPTTAEEETKEKETKKKKADNSWWKGNDYTGKASIKIDLSDQIAYFYKGGQLVGQSDVSTGNSAHRTPTGTYKITEKDIDHASNLYGQILDADGNVIKADADSRIDKVPPGGKYIGAPMKNFMRFNGGIGMHAGHLPGYPASHGCVRMPDYMSAHFYNHASYGTPVRVVP